MIAMPMLPPVFRIRLYMPLALPIWSCGNVAIAIVVNGTNTKPIATPLISIGMIMLLWAISRFINVNR